MVPYGDQSDYKYYNCKCITSRSKKARWSLTQITQKSAGKKSSNLKELFNRKERNQLDMKDN
jgi:hypothetical protein